MADLVSNQHRLTFGFDFARGGSTASRNFSIDNPIRTAEGISAAKAFREEMLGGGSMFSIINPQKFIQPTNWRDTDETEEEWTTTDISITYVDTTTTKIDTGGGGGGGETGTVYIDFSDTTTEDPIGTVVRPGTGTVQVYKESGGDLTAMTVPSPNNAEEVGFSTDGNGNYLAIIGAAGNYPATTAAATLTF